MSLFSPDSVVWFGVALGLVGKLFLVLLVTELRYHTRAWADRVVERRAHRRAQKDLREEAERDE